MNDDPFYDRLSMKFVTGPPQKKLIKFEDIKTYFPIADPDEMIQGNVYLVFNNGLSEDAYFIVKYLGRDLSGNIKVKVLFMRRKSSNRWGNMPAVMRGSRFYKEEEVYKKENVLFPKTYKNLSEDEQEEVEYVFRDLGPDATAITADGDQVESEENAANIIEEIVARKTSGTSGGNRKRRIKHKRSNKKNTKKNTRKYARKCARKYTRKNKRTHKKYKK